MSYKSSAIARMAGVVKNFWDQDRSKRVFREVSDADLAHMKKQYAYVQIVGEVDPNFVVDEEAGLMDLNSGDYGEPVEIDMKTGWVVMYWPPTEEYPAAMSTSPGGQLWGGSADDETDEIGTLVQQTATTACEMVAMAKMLGWKNVHIVNGFPEMSRTVWAVAEANKMPCEGYEPEDGDDAWCKRNSHLIEKYVKLGGPALGVQLGAGNGHHESDAGE